MLQLDTLAGLLSGGDARPSLQPLRCPPASTGRDTCRDCLHACPRGAVTLGRGPVFAESCDGCGACVKACHQEALRETAAKRAAAGGAHLATCAARTVRFRCPWGPSGEASRLVPCLALLDLADLLECVASGAAAVALEAAPCARCERRAGLGPVREAVATARQMLGGTARIDWVAAGDAPSNANSSTATAEAAPLSRRGLFELFGLRASRKVTAWLPPAVDGGAPAGDCRPAAAPAASGAPRDPAMTASLDLDWPAVGPRRARLVAALAGLPAAARIPASSRPFAAIQVDQRCDACSVCTALCPTGALRQVSTPGRASLWFRPRACTGCGLCRDLCAAGALSLEPAISLEALLTDAIERLVEVPLTACEACGLTFRRLQPAGPLCPSCAWRPASRRMSAGKEPLSI